jgi:hypothetical protein
MFESDDDAAAVKAAIATAAGAQRAAKKWRHVLVSSPQAACNWVNATPPQGAGEVSMCRRDDGQVDVFYFM